MDSFSDSANQKDFSRIHLTSAQTITWTIRNILALPQPDDYSLDSPPFVFENATWCLRVYPSHYIGKDHFIGLTLVRLLSLVPHHRLQFNLIWKEEEHFSKHFFSVDFDEDHKENGSKSFIDRQDMDEATYRLLENGNLTLICQISCYGSPGLDVSSQTEIITQDTNGFFSDSANQKDFSQIHLTSAQTITWTIRNFQDLPEETNYSLDSPPFVLENATWCLRVYPGNLVGKVDIGFTLVRLLSRVPHHRLQFNLILKEEEYLWKHFFSVDFDEDHKEKGSKSFIPRLDLCLGELSEMMKTGNLTLICQISCYGSPGLDVSSQTEIITQDTNAFSTAMKVLCQNYNDLLLGGQDHDVVLKVKGKEFRAHRIILRARSPVLESMLSHDMIEKNSGVVDIPDCDPNAFQQFLAYVYCAKMDALNSDNMLPLYYIADKYDMGQLKEECSVFIGQSLSTRNISDVIQLATDHSDAGLLQCATDYFVEHVKLILPTVEWQSFIQRNGIQANELFIKAMNK